MGTNSKLHVQFASRFWRSLGSNGETFADTGYQNTWEVTRAQPGTSGILVDYTGGNVGASFGTGTPESRALTFLEQLEPVLPGRPRRGTGWRRSTSGPRTSGRRARTPSGRSASTSASPGSRAAPGNCHFAGEHTSIDFQGYLNGAVETGQRAAAEILADLK